MRHHERRRETRVTPGTLRARVRTGHTLAIVNVSTAGALVETACQLRPGSRVDVHLERDHHRRLVRAIVDRCWVATIDGRAGILYRAALCFTERCEWVRESTTHVG